MGTTTGHQQRAGATRRRVLTAAAGLGLAGTAGCELFSDEPAPRPAPDPLTPLRDEAIALAATYDRILAAQPGLARRLRPLADAHRAHTAELNRVIGATDPTPTASSTAPTTAPWSGDARAALRELRSAEQQAYKIAARACQQAPANRAALLGSIAAARATHAEALR